MNFQKKHCVAMLLAGGQGSRLMVLTENTAKPAVPFGGKYRIIDFPLSNCVNSGIDTIGVLTQYQPLELNEYIGNGQPWRLNRSHCGVQVLPPYAKSKKSEWYKGTANAIYQNIAMLGAVGSHMRRLHAARILQAAGKTAQDLASLCGVAPFAANKCFAQARRLSDRFCAQAVLLCCEADRQMKTSYDDPARILELLILQLAEEARHD